MKEALRPILALPARDMLAGTGPSAESQIITQDIGRCVKAALQGLPQNYRRVIELRDLEGLPAPAAAHELGITVQALKSRLHRARALLRRQLDACFR